MSIAFLFLKDTNSSCQDISNLILPAKILENSPNLLQSANIINTFSCWKYFTGPVPVIFASISLCLHIHMKNPQIKPLPSPQDGTHFHSNKTSAIWQITSICHDTYTTSFPISKQERSAMGLLTVLWPPSFIQQSLKMLQVAASHSGILLHCAVYLQQIWGLNNFTWKQFRIEMA